ncbi:hypothetical protein BpHYR1_045692 [Brachionus plicatilis]|uniref:Uncharacterized protein n=1 Tax=Brachionus plicatilis TaxID=10195 RepID=A0A3M7SQ41_BRAPC|nr:hypothetical protein BpHYR1_045692 [Brachionus plicatilis]
MLWLFNILNKAKILINHEMLFFKITNFKNKRMRNFFFTKIILYLNHNFLEIFLFFAKKLAESKKDQNSTDSFFKRNEKSFTYEYLIIQNFTITPYTAGWWQIRIHIRVGNVCRAVRISIVVQLPDGRADKTAAASIFLDHIWINDVIGGSIVHLWASSERTITISLNPIELPVIWRPSARLHQIFEQPNQLFVVRTFCELQSPHVSHVVGEFFGKTIAQLLHSCLLLSFTNFFVSFLECIGFEALPWQTSAQKIHDHVSDGLQVVSPALFAPQMGVYAHVPGRASQTLVLRISYVLTGLRIYVLLGKTKVYDTKLSLAQIEQVLETGTQKFHDQGVVLATLTIKIHIGQALIGTQSFVEFVLIIQQWSSGIGSFEFNGHIFVGEQIFAKSKLTKIATANLASNFEVLSHN